MTSVLNLRSVNGKIYLVPVINDDVKHIAKLKQGEKDNKQTKNKPKFHAVYSGGGDGGAGGGVGSGGTNVSATTVEASCNYNSFSTFGPGVTKGGAYVQYELPPRFAKKSAEYHNNNNGINRNYNANHQNNYGSNSLNNDNNSVKKTLPSSSAATASTEDKPAPTPTPTTIVYEGGQIPTETVFKLVTLLEEKTGGLNTSTLASAFRKRFDGEELDFESCGFSTLMEMLKYLDDDVVLQPMSGDAALAHSRKKVPQQLLELFQGSAKKGDSEAKVVTSGTTITADSGRSTVGGAAITSHIPSASQSFERNNNLYNKDDLKTSSISSSSSPPKTCASSAGASSKPGTVVSDAEVIRKVKLIVQEVMDENPNGIMLTRMLVQFHVASKGKELPYVRLGFVNPLSMFDRMKDLIRIERPTPYGDFLLLDVKRVGPKKTEEMPNGNLEETAVIMGDPVFNGAASDVSSSTAASAATCRRPIDHLIIQPPVENSAVAATDSSSTVSSAIAPPSKSTSSCGESTVTQHAAAIQAKTFLLKDMLVQVLKKLGPEGGPIDGIPAIFMKMTGKELNPEEYGFRSMTVLVDNFTDICQVGDALACIVVCVCVRCVRVCVYFPSVLKYKLYVDGTIE